MNDEEGEPFDEGITGDTPNEAVCNAWKYIVDNEYKWRRRE